MDSKRAKRAVADKWRMDLVTFYSSTATERKFEYETKLNENFKIVDYPRIVPI